MKNRAWRVVWRIMLAAAALVLFAAIFLAAYALGIGEWREFDPASVSKMELSTVLYDGGGRAYAVLNDGEDRRYRTLDEIPLHVRCAFLAIEDARFYEHGGVDYLRIAGALWQDIKSGGIVQGASTISQQLVKNAALTGRQTVGRKLTEIMMAYKLESAYSKDKILELYLNRVYFGRGAYGIGTAAIAYFGCDVSKLTIAQGAMLAGILKSTANYAPHLNMKKSIARRNLVLGEMFKNEMISERQLKKSRAEPVVLAQYDSQAYPDGWYTDLALREACEKLGISLGELLGGGYHIYTYLDRELQEAISGDEWPREKDIEVAGVVLGAKTGAILAVRGGREHTARLGFSRATDMKRQPGSAIKPVMVFAPAVEYLGYSTTDFFMDAPASFDGYAPRNAGGSYAGWVTLRTVAAKSINIPAVQLLSEIGVERAKAYAASVGIEFEPGDRSLSLALGGFTTGVSPLSLCAAYQPFASGGSYRRTGCIEKITDKDGRAVYTRSVQEYAVLSEESAYIVSSMLGTAAQEGTARQVYARGACICAKTGTTRYDDADNNRDAWIAAYNADIIVCCWMGCDEGCLPKGFTGGSEPAQMAKSIFEARAGAGVSPELTQPAGIAQVVIDAQALESECCAVRAWPWTQRTLTECYVRGKEPDFPRAWGIEIRN